MATDKPKTKSPTGILPFTSALHWYLLTLATSTIVTWFALDLFQANFARPFEYSGDSLATAAHFKTVFETGWYEFQPLLGAPYGQTYNDFPTADNLHLIAAKILNLFTQNWAIGFNLYFVLGFPLAALTALWFFRKLGISNFFSASLAVTYSIASYHFLRGEAHLWLASYYAIPLGGVLLLSVLRGEQIWGIGNSNSFFKKVLLSPSARSLLCVAILATSSSYYAVFFILLLGISALFRFVAFRSWRELWGSFVLAVTTAVVMLVNMTPDIYYSAVNGINSSGLERSPGEVEYYGIKLTQLLLPWSGHRIPLLREIRALYDGHYPLPGENPSLGVLGALGLTIGLLYLAYSVLGFVTKRTTSESAKQQSSIAILSFLIFVALIFSLTGGLSTIISFFTSSLRGWNRMSIEILLFSLGIVGICLDLAIARWISGNKRKYLIVIPIISILIIAVAFVDQTPTDAGERHNQASTAFNIDQQWVDKIQEQLPSDAMVLQLPYVPFPESSSATGTLGSDNLIPYLHSSTLKWSGGGIKGRPHADYPSGLEQYSPVDLAILSAASDFSGILIDKAASPDQGKTLIEGLESFIAQPAITSDSGRYVFVNLETLTQRITESFNGSELRAISQLVTDPPLPYLAPSFNEVIKPENHETTYVSADPTPIIRLVNMSTENVSGALVFKNESEDLSPIVLEVKISSNKPIWDAATSNLHLISTPGQTQIKVVKSAKDQIISIANIRFIPDQINEFLSKAHSVLGK